MEHSWYSDRVRLLYSRSLPSRHGFGEPATKMTKYVFLALYVAAILGFAVVYTVALPDGSFFHSSLTREAPFRALSVRVTKTIGDAVFSKAGPARFKVGDTYYIVATPAHRGSVSLEGETIRARYLVYVHEDLSKGTKDALLIAGPDYVSDVVVEIRAEDEFPRFQPGQPAILSWRVVSMEYPLTKEALVDFGNWRLNVGEPMAMISQWEYLDIVRFVLASRGTPVGVADHFFRMLYFSIATIATVGYGDIVPVTGLARGLAGLEAFLGIVLIGAFVNSIARK